MTTLWNDIKYGLRMLAKSPGFTIAVILITAVAVGANTAVFSALNQLCLRPLPVNKARDLVGVYYLWRAPDGQSGTEGIFNYPVYEAFRDQPDVFAGLAAFSYEVMPLYTRQDIKQVQGLAVSGNCFSVLGLAPSRGRLFDAQQEPDAAAPPVVVISDRFRRRQFGEDEEVIGRQVVLHDHSLTIVGVTPPGFTGSVAGWVADVYVPLGTYAAMTHNNFHRGTWTWLHFLGRLKPGIGREQAELRLSAVSTHLKESGLENVGNHVTVADGSRGYAEVARGLPRPLAILMVAAAFVLTIASLNIANMQLSRAMVRQREIAIRRALGAGRWRIVRQLSVEGLLLALAGGMCGVVVAIWLDRVVCGLVSRMGSVSMAGGIDSRVLLFALAASLLAGLVFGLAPALQAVRRDVTGSLKESSAFIGVFSSRWNPHHVLVVAQVAIAVAISACAGLFLRSVAQLHRIDPGYDTRRLLAVSLEGHTLSRPDLRGSVEGLYERIKGLPGVEVSCLSGSVPLSERGSMRGVIAVDGIGIAEGERRSLSYDVVSPEYFKTLNMPLLAGRLFSAQDSPQAPPVIVINDVMARQYWPHQNPVGRSLTFRGGEGKTMTVVGVVRASTMRSILEGTEPMAYWPLSQDTRFTPAVLIRTTGDPRSLIPILRKEAAALRLPEGFWIGTVADRVAELLFPQHALTAILNAFSLAGLLLCATGLYGVITCAVNRRTREIGIRMALGARTRDVVLPILGQGLWLTVVGLGFGLGTSFLAMRVLKSQLPGLQHWDKFILYGVNVWDLATVIAVPLLLLSVAAIACTLPARRAAKIDPMEALRCE